MQQHTKNYFKAYNIEYDFSGWHEFIPCEVCDAESVDLHHIENRMKGVKRLDEHENIIALCRCCHEKAHSGILTKDELRQIHKNNK